MKDAKLDTVRAVFEGGREHGFREALAVLQQIQRKYGMHIQFDGDAAFAWREGMPLAIAEITALKDKAKEDARKAQGVSEKT